MSHRQYILVLHGQGGDTYRIHHMYTSMLDALEALAHINQQRRAYGLGDATASLTSRLS